MTVTIYTATTNANFTCNNDGWVSWTNETVENVLIPLEGVNWIVSTILSLSTAPDLARSWLWFYKYLTAIVNFSGYFGAAIYWFLREIPDQQYAQYWCDAAGWLANGTDYIYPLVEELQKQFLNM